MSRYGDHFTCAKLVPRVTGEGHEVTDERPPLSDLPHFVEWVRGGYGSTLVASRRAAEQRARELLNDAAGTMTADQALELGRLFNTGEWDGVMHYNRFSPAFGFGGLHQHRL